MKKNKKVLIISLLIVSLALILGYIFINKKNSNYVAFETQKDKGKNVIVLGSEPEAITAAVTAARLGYTVNMITEDKQIGGLFTEGMLTALDLNYVNGSDILHEGFFTEFYNAASNGHNLDLVKTQEFFDQVVKHKNLPSII